jgi:peptidoglycan/LPS O-acetylase OafA/YrhL
MLFFLVSGFCVHYPYAAGARSLDLCSYSKRRFLRIYPPYFAVVILCILTEWGLRHYFNQNTSSASTVFKTVFMIQNYGPDAGK